MKINNKIIAFSIPLCLLVATAANTRLDPARQIRWPTGAAGCVYAPGSNTCVAVVTAIDSQTGAFTFSGAGVSHIGNAYTFSGTGSGVTSVAMTVPSWLTVSGSPITTSGTLAVTGTSEAQNLFLASPNGSSGAMTPRSIVAADIPTLNQNTTGTSAGLTGSPAITVASVLATILYTNAEFSNGTCTTAKTINPANGNKQNVTLTAADTCALTFTQPGSGTATVQVKVTQSAAGSFNGGISTIGTCKWPGGVTPTITQTTGAIDTLSAYLDGTNAYCQIAQSFQ